MGARHRALGLDAMVRSALLFSGSQREPRESGVFVQRVVCSCRLSGAGDRAARLTPVDGSLSACSIVGRWCSGSTTRGQSSAAAPAAIITTNHLVHLSFMGPICSEFDCGTMTLRPRAAAR